MPNLDDDPVSIYIRELEDVPPLTKQEETQLFQLIKRGEDAEKRLIESNLRLVVQIAKHYGSADLPMLELIQEGNLGLMRAVRQFPDSKRDDFLAYATACIEKATSDALARKKRR